MTLLWCPFPAWLARLATSLLAPSALRPMLASPGLCCGCLLLGFRCSCCLALARFLTHSRRGVTGPGTGPVDGPSSGNQSRPGAALPPSTQWSFLFLRLAKNTPDRNPATLQQTRKLGPLKLGVGLWWKGSAGLLRGLQGPSGTLQGAKLTSGHPLLHAQLHLTRDFPCQSFLMDYRRSLLCLGFPI